MFDWANSVGQSSMSLMLFNVTREQCLLESLYCPTSVLNIWADRTTCSDHQHNLSCRISLRLMAPRVQKTVCSTLSNYWLVQWVTESNKRASSLHHLLSMQGLISQLSSHQNRWARLKCLHFFFFQLSPWGNVRSTKCSSDYLPWTEPVKVHLTFPSTRKREKMIMLKERLGLNGAGAHQHAAPQPWHGRIKKEK